MPVVAADIMSSPVITVKSNSTLREIAQLMSQHHISAVPVVDDGGKVIGIVSEANVLKPYREKIVARRRWWLDLIAEGEELPPNFLDYLRQDHHTAVDIMERNVVTGEHQMSIPELAELAVTHGVRRLPIVRDGKLVGIISRADLVRVIAQTPSVVE